MTIENVLENLKSNNIDCLLKENSISFIINQKIHININFNYEKYIYITVDNKQDNEFHSAKCYNTKHIFEYLKSFIKPNN